MILHAQWLKSKVLKFLKNQKIENLCSDKCSSTRHSTRNSINILPNAISNKIKKGNLTRNFMESAFLMKSLQFGKHLFLFICQFLKLVFE